MKSEGKKMIAIASDHAGYELKKQLKKYFDKRNVEYKDLGAYSLESVDYPDLELSWVRPLLAIN